MRQWRVQSKLVTHYSSDFTASPLALTQSAAQIQVVHLHLGKKIGMHQTSIAQRLYCISGKVRLTTGTHHSLLNEGEIVEWEKGEWHETEAILPSILMIVETERFA